jgi:ABC-type molybdenum transport system ATPase subunit/photorepair protein PhrA
MSYQTKVRANYLNRTAKLAFFKARQRQGDVNRISEETGYSSRMVYYTISGERKVNNTIANAMYMVARRRQKNAEYANA